MVMGNSTTGDVAGISSVLATDNYYFSTAGFRPFIGIGLSLVNVASAGTVTVNDGQTQQNVTFSEATKLGAMARAGFKTGHFVLGVEYNAISASNAISISLSNLGSLSVKNSCFGIKFGFDIGGGIY